MAGLQHNCILIITCKFSHSHIARHTFGTTVTLTNGVPIESVSKMPGHKKQHYTKVLDKKVSEDMQILKDKFLSMYYLSNEPKTISN